MIIGRIVTLRHRDGSPVQMDNKTNLPDSDRSVRSNHPDAGDENVSDADTSIPNLQTSNKSGKHSTVEKLAASRPEFGSGRGAQTAAGGFGDDEEHVKTGRLAAPDSKQFRCNSCGRWFDTAEELSAHEPECRSAKMATSAGQSNLADEDAKPHRRNDAG